MEYEVHIPTYQGPDEPTMKKRTAKRKIKKEISRFISMPNSSYFDVPVHFKLGDDPKTAGDFLHIAIINKTNDSYLFRVYKIKP